MTNIELIINGQRADVGKDFGIRLSRQLLNPSELNTKDAQFSYGITLPPSDINHAIFGYSNVEETRDKFNREYTAELIVNSIRVFPPAGSKGFFRMADISGDYKGNLYVPVAKTVKDIFGEIKLNENPEYRIDFEDFATSVNLYNLAAATEPQAAIFPYTLYGVMPKLPLTKDGNTYSARDVWDYTVRLGMSDLLPSINPLKMLKHIFNAQGYDLQGTAFNDNRLALLYQSYKNADTYTPPWNYGQHAKIHITGSWSSRYNKRTSAEQLERGVNQGDDLSGHVYACDFFDATNTLLNVLEDTGGNVLYKEIDDSTGRTFVQAQIRIPVAGFYKVEFNANLKVSDAYAWRTTDGFTGVQHMGGETQNTNNNFSGNMYEVRLCRDKGTAAFGLGDPKLNGVFYYDNQPQTKVFDSENIPKYFPQYSNGGTNFVDALQDSAHLMGFNFGSTDSSDFFNPKAPTGPNDQILVSKPALSWDAAASADKVTRLAVKSLGYWKYGRIGDFDNEGDNPNTDLDYSAGPFATGKVLDAQGNPTTPSFGNIGVRIDGYFLDINTGFQSPSVDWEVSDFLDLAEYSNVAFSSVVSDGPDVAITAFYDINLQFIGYGIQGPSTGDPAVTYTDEPVNAPFDAAYVRISGRVDSPMTITADSSADGNVILNRFDLARFYTYRIETDPADGYEGYAYVHDGATSAYLLRVPFVGGVATFSSTFAPLLTVDPKLTLYLTTPDFDVDGTLVISRQIEDGSEEVIDWELTDKYEIELINAPANFAKRGQYHGSPADGNWYAEGKSSGVVWLEAGELLTVASVASDGKYRQNGMHTTYGWVSHDIDFDLSVQPFRTDKDWLKVDLNGNGTDVMDWNDPVNFDTDSINLVGFLSADVKTDDYIENFCKAYNLRLSQIGTNAFSLDIKQSKTAVSSQFINLDNLASVKDRSNSPLGLPFAYKIGFTVDKDEEGFAISGDDGGGSFETGALSDTVVEQTSNFSYNWLKEISKVEDGGTYPFSLAVISKADVWAAGMPYPEAMQKRYTDLAFRFWYYGGLLNDSGASFEFNGDDLQIAAVKNEIAGLSYLSYKNAKYTILDNYFTLLINGSSHYTEVEGYLTPAQYQALDGSIMAMFNGDMYFVAELGAYDPNGRNKTKIKLIRKI